MNMEAKVRDSNIEILRIVLMTMILLSHLISHGKYEFPDNSVILSVQDAGILTFTRYHVNTFILISGFFSLSSLSNFIAINAFALDEICAKGPFCASLYIFPHTHGIF